MKIEGPRVTVCFTKLKKKTNPNHSHKLQAKKKVRRKFGKKTSPFGYHQAKVISKGDTEPNLVEGLGKEGPDSITIGDWGERLSKGTGVPERRRTWKSD